MIRREDQRSVPPHGRSLIADMIQALERRRHIFRTVAQNLLTYGIAGGIIWYETRDISVSQLLNSIRTVDLRWFIPATLVSVCIWYFGETLLYARMFTYFHEHTGYIELMPATAAAYFLQVVNILVAAGALVLFLHRRKNATWSAASFTILFLGFIDGFLLSLLTLLSGLFIKDSPLHRFLPYAGAAFGALTLVLFWWIRRQRWTRLEKWVRTRPALVSFRTASPSIYLELSLIRLGIFVPQGFIFYVCMTAFHVGVPMLTVLAVTPAILAAGGLPFTPVGLGPLQAVAVHELAHFAPASRILGAFLLFSVFLLVYRLPLGLGSARFYVKTLLVPTPATSKSSMQ
ncbi:MAG: flippase-like domain-containing protein [Deltaproteobacteria bacterium]|nr:flippase-like domain-containing protein [Deltaproteobacteria bacterium]